MQLRRYIGVALVVGGAQLLWGSCGGGDGAGPAGNSDATLVVQADVSGTAVASVVVEVAGPDMVTPLVFNIPIVAGVAMGTVTVSAGSNRTITIRAFDAGGIETHSGAVTVNIQHGINTTVTMTLVPETGSLPIHTTLGSVRVTLTPSHNSLTAGQTVQLVPTIVDALGVPVSGTVKWATRDPGVATVDTITGLVTARGLGQTSIFAVFAGAAGAADVTVIP